MNRFFIGVLAFLGVAGSLYADNPLFTYAFSADPTARVFEGKIYLYPSHDIIPPNGGRGFCMEDYHVYSSENLMDWHDHGVIVTQTEVPWVSPTYGMWAPDCVYKNGKYYFYFPANSKDTSSRRQGVQRVGVAVAEKPYGPFKPEENCIPDIPPGIDPCVLIDPKDGKSYLFYSMNAIFVAPLKENMLEMEVAPVKIPNLPTQGLVEGPFAFERKGKYYLTFPHATSRERLEYAMADNPMGPYTMQGVIMDEHESRCWTNHHSIVEYKGQWYLFYHDRDLSTDDTRRSARADFLYFNDDGTIQKVIPTQRGVGICSASAQIQVDRFSDKSQAGAEVSYLDPANPPLGWKVALNQEGAFVRYNRVDFADNISKGVKVRLSTVTDTAIEIRLDRIDGPVIAKINAKADSQWQIAESELKQATRGQHDLFVVLPDKAQVSIDWVQFN